MNQPRSWQIIQMACVHKSALARPAAQRLHHLKVALRLGQIAREHTVDHHVAKVNGILILRAIEVLHFGAAVEGLARVFQPVARAVPQEPLESKVALQFPLALANCLGDLCHKGKVNQKLLNTINLINGLA